MSSLHRTIGLAVALFIGATAAQTNQGTTTPPTVAPANANENQQAPTATRLLPPGNATIDCAVLSDSRCKNNIVAGAAPTCTLTANPASLTITSGSVQSTLTATCTTGTTQYQWTAPSGPSTPTGQSFLMTFYSAGTYCYTVAGKNPSVSLNYGTASAQACVNVTQGASCPPASNYSQSLSCPNGYTGSITRFWTYDTVSCGWSFSDSNNCSIPSCTGGMSWNGSSCACPGGTFNNGGICTVIPTCTGNTVLLANNTCGCNAPQVLQGGQCVTPVTCDPTQFQDTTLTCPGNQIGTWIQRAFMQCPAGTFGSPSTITNTCACASGFTWNAGAQACQPSTPTSCTGGQVLIAGSCQCQAPTVWNGSSCQTPACPSGQIRDAVSGNCVPQSVSVSTWMMLWSFVDAGTGDQIGQAWGTCNGTFAQCSNNQYPGYVNWQGNTGGRVSSLDGYDAVCPANYSWDFNTNPGACLHS